MHENLEKIKSLEGQPKIIKNFLNSEEIELFLITNELDSYFLITFIFLCRFLFTDVY